MSTDAEGWDAVRRTVLERDYKEGMIDVFSALDGWTNVPFDEES